MLAALCTVVDDAASAGDRIGLFAAVYRQVKATIAERLADKLSSLPRRSAGWTAPSGSEPVTHG